MKNYSNAQTIAIATSFTNAADFCNGYTRAGFAARRNSWELAVKLLRLLNAGEKGSQAWSKTSRMFRQCTGVTNAGNRRRASSAVKYDLTVEFLRDYIAGYAPAYELDR